MRTTIWAAAIVLATGPHPFFAQEPPRDASRDRPSKYVSCPRDHLTSYTGLVTEYRRENGRTTLTIRTDWDTTERVELKHPGTDDPSRWFLLRGRPFTPDDWKEVEVERGRLKPKLRATAWVCDDGTNAIVDWDRPREK
jgi:hypothetical protein